jgi:hypothetical protein
MGASTDAESAAPFPIPAHQTGRADLPHPAFRLASPLDSRTRVQLDISKPQDSESPNTTSSLKVAGAARLHRKLVLRLAIQLVLKFSDLTRCCQTHRQSPLLPSFTSTPEVRALSSAGITRHLRSYGPLRLPDWPPPLLTTFGVATPGQSRASLTNPDHLLCIPCSIPRWTGSGARWLASGAFPRRVLPCPCCLPR